MFKSPNAWAPKDDDHHTPACNQVIMISVQHLSMNPHIYSVVHWYRDHVWNMRIKMLQSYMVRWEAVQKLGYGLQ